MSQRYDVIVIGAGIIGLATARELLLRHPKLKVLVLEKEKDIAMHQTGHNSGVIHSGIYYKPGSMKAKTCMAGRRALLKFCDEKGIKYQLCGKVIVATDESELPKLEELFRRGTANGVRDLEIIGPERLKEIEPHAVGIKALYSPEAGIVDFTEVAKELEKDIRRLGGEIQFGYKVRNINELPADHVINCAGLFSDIIAGLKDVRIVPFRGEYYRLAPESEHLVKALIYPVPDPRFPFLGVHFTRNIRGFVEAGPNAVLAYAREGYRKRDINLKHFFKTLTFSGFHAIARKYWRIGASEFYRSYSKRVFTKSLRKLIPEIKESDLVTGGSGVRAQAVGSDGTLFDDFVIRQSGKAIHVINAPSPAATASLAIATTIVDKYIKF